QYNFWGEGGIIQINTFIYMSAFQRARMKEEKQQKLQERRERLRIMLQEERDQLEAELRNVCPDRATLTRQLVEKTDALWSAREERRNNCLKCLCVQVETELCKDHVVSQWQVQQQERKQADERTREEKQRFENEYERTRREEKKRAEDLRKQMEELQLREQEAEHLKQEQEALMSQCWELEKLEDERKRMEESRRKTEFGHFLTRQYCAQLKRRAQQVQEDWWILAALLEGEVEEQRLEKARRERAVTDAAWMKRVIEEQLQLEREREAEFDVLYREEAQRVWEKERRARERLMREVLTGRQQQLEERMKENRLARDESLQRREELIQQLEQERLTRRQEREQQEGARTTRMQEISAQVEQRRREQWEEQRRQEQEELQERKELRQQEEELHLHMLMIYIMALINDCIGKFSILNFHCTSAEVCM
uniref:Trichoplein, keratin filament binding n=1 Tax=Sinocyclocheilus anshuiensis TaxID=1608454 RepID=A0A671Q4D6_9TELE